MIQNSKVLSDFKLLIESENWEALRAFFVREESGETVRVVVYEKELSHEIDTGVSTVLVDKVLLWGKFFLPEYFRDPYPGFAREVLALLLSKDNQYLAAPRGFSKTTLIQLLVCFLCVHGLERFIVVVEKSFCEAAELLRGVHRELRESERIRVVYGELLESSEKDLDGDFYVNGVRLRAKGVGSSLRGMKSGEWRPTLIICDDIEENGHVENPEQRKKYFDSYNAEIQPALDVTGRVKVLGTILHRDSLLAKLVELHRGKVYRAFYREGEGEYESMEGEVVELEGYGRVKLLWPERWSGERLLRKREEMRGRGESSAAFAREYLNDPVGEGDRAFRAEWLYDRGRRIELAEVLKMKNLYGFAAIDVAESLARGADYTGVLVHLVDSSGQHYRVHCRREKRNIRGLIDLIFEVWERWYPYGLQKIGIEKKAFSDQVLPLLDEEKRRRNVFPLVEELSHLGRSKESRILGALQGRYELGKIWTCVVGGKEVGDTSLLLSELYDFPVAVNDDLSDAEAYISDLVSYPSGVVDLPLEEMEFDPYE